MRRRPVAAIYKEGLINEREKRGDQNMVIQLPRCLDIRKGIKDKDPLKDDVVAGFRKIQK